MRHTCNIRPLPDLLAVLALFCILGLFACDADHVSWSYTSNTEGTRVHVVVVDAPREDIRAFYLTITEIAFVDDDFAHRVVYESRRGHRVDLFALRRSAQGRPFDLATWGATLPESRFDRIRISVRDPEIVLSTGEVVPSSAIDTIGNGKIERVLAAPVHTVPGETLYLLLDFDLESSLEHDPGRFRPWVYRPVLLVRCTSGHPPELTRSTVEVSGRIHDMNAARGTFDLDLDGERGVCDLALRQGALVFDAGSIVVPPGSVADGMEGTVHATLTAEGKLEALSVHLSQRLRATGKTVKSMETPPAPPSPLSAAGTIRGTVLSRMSPSGRVPVVNPANNAYDLLITPETDILLLEELPGRLRQTPIPARSLRPGQRVQAVRAAGKEETCRVVLVEETEPSRP